MNAVHYILVLWIATATLLRGQNAWPDAGSVAEAMTRANNYWITNNSLGNAGWARAAYFTGNQRAARVLANRTYVTRAFAWGAANQWLIGPEGAGSADAYDCGQTYLDLYQLYPQPVEIADLTNRVNAWLASPATNQLTWIDAFYMAGPTFVRVGNLTGNTNYYQKLWSMYSYMKDGLGLFDTNTSLWYRDATYIYPAATNLHGGKVFWARGNGWVFAGLATVLKLMPTNAPHYQDFAAMFQTMAPALKAVQGGDGMWRSSLYDAAQYPNPETSGTGFFTYGFAWGIRSGLLAPADYTNSVMLAWNGLTNLALNAQGLVGYVQGVGAAPAAATATSTVDFGVGAFLLACSEIALLATNGPALGPWAGADQTVVDTNPPAPVAFSLDGSQTEIYRGSAGNFSWWEGTSQIATGTNAQVSLSPGLHVITLKVGGVDGITYADTMTVTVITQTPPVLKLQFDFEDAGNTTTDFISGVSLNLVNSSGALVDLHGGAGTGVGGYGKSLNFVPATMGGSGPMAFTTNNAGLAFGSLNAFTLTLWIKPASSLLVSTFPRFFSLATNGVTDRSVANSLQLLSNGNIQPSTTAVQAFVNTLQPSTATFGGFNMPMTNWSFLALTYDGTTLNFYGGSEINPVSLQSSVTLSAGPVNLNGTATLMLGNRLALDRAFSGQLDAVRFYAGASSPAALESIRASALALPAIAADRSGTNLVFKLNTRTNASYVLQATAGLTPPDWTAVLTNTGLGTLVTNTIPFTAAPTQQFFRYQIQ